MHKHSEFILGLTSVTVLFSSAMALTPAELLLLELTDPLYKLTANALDISIDPNDIGFYLYPNSDDLWDADKLTYNDPTSISGSRYNTSNPVIFMSHGFIQTYLSEYPYYVKKAYLEANYPRNTNIIAVDWGKLAGQPIGNIVISTLTELPAYIVARKNVEIVGKRLSDFLVFLLNNQFLSSANQIHLEGQSLGAHVSGMAGLFFQQTTSNNVARITGTDPAGPLFDFVPVDQRLDKTDADFVDIVHTNQGEMGYIGDLGDIDYYVNGGSIQPPCENHVNATDVFCSHNLAPRYFAISIANPNLQACNILNLLSPKKCVTFGEHVSPTTRGTYSIKMDSYQQ